MNKRIKIAFIICGIAAFVIMVVSKLLPFIPSNWSMDCCQKWNDFWFGFSCSLFCSFIVAFTMYYFTELKPKKEFAKQVKPILKRKLELMHQTYDSIFRQFGEIGNFGISEDDDLERIMKKKNWAEKIEKSNISYGDLIQDKLIELWRLTTEFLTYSRYLENNQIIKIEDIVNMVYCGILTAKGCTTDSTEMQKSLITGNVLINWLQLYDRDTFVNDVFVPSYRKLLELEKTFN